VVLFFDLSSMQPEELTRVVAAARTYTGQLTPADLVAVVSLSTTWRVLQDFTADRARLDRVVGQLDPNGGLGFEEGSTGDADGTSDNGAAFTPDETEVNIFNTDRRLEALRALADALGGIEERKSVVYFSSGMSQTGLENRVQIRAVIDEYQTTSLYFDNASYDVFNRRGSFGRSKYRIRRYGEESSAFLERSSSSRACSVRARTRTGRTSSSTSPRRTASR